MREGKGQGYFFFIFVFLELLITFQVYISKLGKKTKLSVIKVYGNQIFPLIIFINLIDEYVSLNYKMKFIYSLPLLQAHYDFFTHHQLYAPSPSRPLSFFFLHEANPKVTGVILTQPTPLMTSTQTVLF